MPKDTGRLILRLEYDRLYIKRIHFFIPALNFQKDNLFEKTEIDKIPKGNHRAILTLYPATGRAVKQEIALHIEPEKDNFQTVNLYDVPQAITIRPVNAKEKTVPATEVKIEGVDSSFRPVRDEDGVNYALRPGKYTVKVVTPSMDVKSFEIEIKENLHVYSLPVEEKEEDRADPRIELNMPAAYQTEDGTWHSTRTINISSRGVCLIREPKSPKESRIFVRLLIPVTANMVECFATTKWSKDSKVDPSLLGLELEVDESTRNEIRKWLEAHSNMKSVSHNFIRK